MTETPLVARGRPLALIAGASLAFVLTTSLAAAQTALPPPSVDAQADARQDRIEELQAQLRQATADNEQLQHQLMDAQREVARLQGIIGSLSAANQSAVQSAATPPAAPTPAAQPPKPSDAVSAAQAAHTGTLGTVPANAVQAGAPAANAGPDAGAAYSRARQLLIQGNYPEAESAFDDFIHTYPSADNAADARYWLAFTLLARNNYDDAATNFLYYLQHWPRGPRAPDAQVRLGVALGELGQTRQSCAAFNTLANTYPRASREVRDMAQREAAARHCGA